MFRDAPRSNLLEGGGLEPKMRAIELKMCVVDVRKDPVQTVSENTRMYPMQGLIGKQVISRLVSPTYTPT